MFDYVFNVLILLFTDVPAGESVFVKVPPGKVTVGKPLNFPSYGWDNEYGRMDVE